MFDSLGVRKCSEFIIFRRVSRDGGMRVMRKTLALAGSFFLLGTMIAFFGFHTIAGERGIMARPQLERKIMLAEEQLAVLKKQKDVLEHRVGLLQNGAVDADILSEKARSDLGLYAPGDVIISIELPELKF